MKVKCIECDHTMALKSDTKVSEIVICTDCEAELEVLSLDPLELIMAPEIEEDWGE